MRVDRDVRAERQRVCRAYRSGQRPPHFVYSSDEDSLWSSVFGALGEMHEELSCAKYRSAARLVRLPTHQVPQLSEVSRTLHSLTGFELAPTIGTLPSRLFYGPLAHGILNATPDVRPVAEQSFSPDPDIIHELVGHAVMLADPEVAELYRCFGRAINDAGSAELSSAIARLFWFTMEVGLVVEKGCPRVFGAAILSSVAEMETFAHAELREFQVDDVIAGSIDDGMCQPVLYVADSVGYMIDEVRRFLATSVGRDVRGLSSSPGS